MSSLVDQNRLVALRASIADIERRPVLAEARALPQQGQAGAFPILAGGLMQEVFTPERRNSGAALGFALAQAGTLLNGKRQAVVYLQLASEAQEMGLPYGPGLVSFGFDPDAMVLIRPASIVELLWAAEEALACMAVAAVIADIAGQPKALDFTASRRLSLRADSRGTSMFVLRYGVWRQASAAHLRWALTPEVSAETPFDVRAPGGARWRSRLEKGVIGERQNQDWLLEWSEHGFQIIEDGVANTSQPATEPALPEPVPAALGYRYDQTA